MHRIRPRAALILATAFSVALVPAAAADAAVAGYSTTTRWIGGGTAVNVRSAPSVTSAVVRSLPTGTPIVIDCQLIGGRLGFSSWADNRTWDRLTDGTYVHDVVTTTPSGPHTSLPDGGYVAWSSTIAHCPVATAAGGTAAPAPASAPGAAAAVAYADALARSGSVTAPPQDIDPVWAQEGSFAGEWSGDCVRLVQIAWKHSGVSTRVLAANTADLLSRRYSLRSGAAPAGALVFWRAGGGVGSAGHVALSDGAGGVYTTLGKDHAASRGQQPQPVTHIGLSDLAVRLGYGYPTGWSMP